jgi:hypothetical protein
VLEVAKAIAMGPAGRRLERDLQARDELLRMRRQALGVRVQLIRVPAQETLVVEPLEVSQECLESVSCPGSAGLQETTRVVGREPAYADIASTHPYVELGDDAAHAMPVAREERFGEGWQRYTLGGHGGYAEP